MIRLSDDATQLYCDGKWVVSNISELHAELKSLSTKLEKITHLNLSGIVKMDTAGALFLSDLVKQLRDLENVVHLSGLKNKFQSLFSLVSNESSQRLAKPEELVVEDNMFSVVGKWAYDKYLQCLAFFAFIGEFMLIVFRNLLNPVRIQWKSTFKIVDETGYRALPIVGLMSFLIGLVLAYQLTTELKTYGATVFVVDVSGIAILREFAPLITAIIIAGRSSTAFAALIGTMKVNEEIDALRTMGIAPLERLVLPRVFGVIISLPLLTIWANIFGVLGSMVMAYYTVDLNFLGYLERFSQVVAVKQLILGMVKTPIFGMIIAAVGCFQGFQTGSSADSVGWQTTKSAVQAIFLIIVADATFSVLFSMMGL